MIVIHNDCKEGRGISHTTKDRQVLTLEGSGVPVQQQSKCVPRLTTIHNRDAVPVPVPVV